MGGLSVAQAAVHLVMAARDAAGHRPKPGLSAVEVMRHPSKLEVNELGRHL
jgi:hypothetical protein